MTTQATNAPRSQLIPALCVLGAALLFFMALHFAHRTTAAERYKECSTLALSDPAKAKTLAEQWLSKNAKSPIARHCEALADFGLKEYAPAATLLEELAKEPLTQKPKLSASLLVQAATARHALGHDLLAVQDLDYALTLDADSDEAKALLGSLNSTR